MDNVALFFLIFSLSAKSPLADKFMVFGADYLIFLTFFLVLILAIFKGSRERKAAILSVLGLIISAALIKAVRLFFFEPRPFITFSLTPLIKHAPDASFPSTHTTAMATIAFSYLFTKSKYFLLFFSALLWVGFSRIYVGVHYPLDVAGGIVLGFISISLTWKVVKWIRSR